MTSFPFLVPQYVILHWIIQIYSHHIDACSGPFLLLSFFLAIKLSFLFIFYFYFYFSKIATIEKSKYHDLIFGKILSCNIFYAIKNKKINKRREKIQIQHRSSWHWSWHGWKTLAMNQYNKYKKLKN